MPGGFVAGYDDRRGSAAQRGYGYKWQQARDGFLRSHPLCVECERNGRVAAATVVDHIQPHRGDMGLFWDKENWQALCASCHSGVKQRLEKSGRVIGCGVDGVPVDPNHHWNIGRRRGGG